MKTRIIILLFFVANFTFAQKKTVAYTDIRIADWVVPNKDTAEYSFGEYMGEKALLMKRKVADYKKANIIYPKDLNFADGSIEMDVAWIGKQGGYIGLAFRIKDPHHYETVYFRPESSGTINAMQYMPEKKAEFNWWDYEDAKHQAKATLPLHNWFHIKAVFKGQKLMVFANGDSKPVYTFNGLDNSLKSGSAGFYFGNSQSAAYKNMVITEN